MPHKSEISQLIDDIEEEILYMQEMGVDAFDSELPATDSRSVLSPMPAETVQEAKSVIPDLKSEISKPKANGSRLAALPSLKKRNGHTKSSIEPSQLRPDAEPSPDSTRTPSEDTVLFDVAPALAESSDTIETIRADIGECTRCPLFSGRTQIVHTTGNFKADLMFVGEAPGADEDAQGFPFVGRAGQLLTKIIEGIGYKREDVAIGNINRCRPPANRAPTIEEAHTCRPFLLREINVIRPKVIVVLGNTALHNLLDTKVGITKMRGKFQDYFGVKVMPTFHPAYLLRDPNKKREVWEDMKVVRDYLTAN
jgi:DNA polymerase